MTAIEGCRSCAARDLHEVLALGEVPLANALLRPDQIDSEERRFPLTLMACPRCSLVQIKETVAPEILFSEYLYFSSYSTTMQQHAATAVDAYTERFGLGADSLVVEIASNDGYLLRHFVSRGVPVLGIEPAANIARVAEERGVATRVTFFGKEAGEELAREGKRADLIIANNVLAHVADTNGMVAGMAAALRPAGHVVCEFPYLLDMIDQVEFDTIYHEHLCYFSLHAVQALFRRHALELVDVEHLDIHGGSLRVFFAHRASGGTPSARVSEMLSREGGRRITDPDSYRPFALAVGRLKQELTGELRRRKERGEKLAAYGASAKGSTLMNTFGIGRESLDYVVDRSDVKQGHFTPGNHLPILSPEALMERRPDAVLLLTWNFAQEILRQQAPYLEAGGCFIIPLPEVRSVGKEGLD